MDDIRPGAGRVGGRIPFSGGRTLVACAFRELEDIASPGLVAEIRSAWR